MLCRKEFGFFVKDREKEYSDNQNYGIISCIGHFTE